MSEYESQSDDFFCRDLSEEDPAPKVRGGHFVPHDDAWGFSEWGQDWFDYLLAHPEIILIKQFVPRTFHICTNHPFAQQTLKTGHIPKDFVCPLANDHCFMRQILQCADGKSLTLHGDKRTGQIVALPVIDA